MFDTQGGRFLKSDKYGEITRIFDENDNTIEISISTYERLSLYKRTFK